MSDGRGCGHCAGGPVPASTLPSQHSVHDSQHHLKDEETEFPEVSVFRARTATGGVAGVTPELCEPKPSCPL